MTRVAVVQTSVPQCTSGVQAADGKGRRTTLLATYDYRSRARYPQ